MPDFESKLRTKEREREREGGGRKIQHSTDRVQLLKSGEQSPVTVEFSWFKLAMNLHTLADTLKE
jgi:hypothetical protein